MVRIAVLSVVACASLFAGAPVAAQPAPDALVARMDEGGPARRPTRIATGSDRRAERELAVYVD